MNKKIGLIVSLLLGIFLLTASVSSVFAIEDESLGNEANSKNHGKSNSDKTSDYIELKKKMKANPIPKDPPTLKASAQKGVKKSADKVLLHDKFFGSDHKKQTPRNELLSIDPNKAGGQKKQVAPKGDIQHLNDKIKILEEAISNNKSKREACANNTDKEKQHVCKNLPKNLKALEADLAKAKEERVRLVNEPMVKLQERIMGKKESVDESAEQKQVEQTEKEDTNKAPFSRSRKVD